MKSTSKIVADSLSHEGVRLTTWEAVFPRIILAEVNTHRMLSRNSASSRAIPVAKMIAAVQETPYIPQRWGRNQPGMQAATDLVGDDALECERSWLLARDAAVKHATWLLDIGLHKQTANRLLEPWMWHTALITGTEVSNLFHLRDHPGAHPDFQDLAVSMREEMELREPLVVAPGDWHLPLITFDDEVAFSDVDPAALPQEELPMASAGRCARVSYVTHATARDISKDIELGKELVCNGHMSPLEHPARPATEEDASLPGCRVHPDHAHSAPLWPLAGGASSSSTKRINPQHQWHGNFRGWVQLRKLIDNEADPLGTRHGP